MKIWFELISRPHFAHHTEFQGKTW